jgi:hypothetical protein
MILVAGAGAREFPAARKKFCSEHSNYATVAIEAKSASWEWKWSEDDWKRGWIGRCNVAFARPEPTGQSSVTRARGSCLLS